MKVIALKVNGLPEPLGYGSETLLLTWRVEEARDRAAAETVVQAALDPEFKRVIWSARGTACDSLGTVLDFPPAPRTRYYLRVCVTGEAGERGEGFTWLETGKRDEPWAGRWIGPPAGTAASPLLLGRFAPAGPVRAARLYVSGLGLYEARINGARVGDDVLTPGLSRYEQGVCYQSYDVTGLLAGENELSILLGNGWYKGRFGLEGARPFGERYAAVAEVRLTLADGREQVFATGEDWTWRRGEVYGDGIYDGETLDRLSGAGPEEEAPVQPVEISLALEEPVGPPVQVVQVLEVERVLRTPAGETVLDFGQNHTGWLRFRSRLPRGARVDFSFGEVLQNGNFYNENYRSATGGFHFVSDGREAWVQPRFTFFGFRYVRVSGWPGEPDPADFRSPVLGSRLERTGFLETGNARLNRLYENALWSQKSNFLDIPTDCPQRDERLGWTGDAQVFAPTACYNMDTRAFYRKFLRLLRQEQEHMDGAVPTYFPGMGERRACAAWSDAATLLPAALHRFYGGTAALAEHYPLMRDWVDYVTARNPRRLYENGFQLGDWLALDGITPQSFKGGTDDCFAASLYYFRSAELVARAAALLGRDKDAAEYGRLAEEIRRAVLDAYFTPAGRLSVDTQAAYVLALHFGVWREREVLLAQFRRRLRLDAFTIRCGFLGAPLLCATLARAGMDGLALHFLLQRGFPGWMYCVDLGATTIWERWNSLLPDGACSGTGMNSFNHYAYGSVMEYVYGYLAGLRPAAPGFREAVVDPRPTVRLGHVSCTYHAAAGTYVCNWRIQADGAFRLHLQVPFGCAATVTLPRSGRPPFRVEAGQYDYAYRPEPNFRRVYGMDTRLGELEGDREARAVLKRRLPQLCALLEEGNAEFTTQTFRELGQAFYLGLTPELAEGAAAELAGLIRWGEDGI